MGTEEKGDQQKHHLQRRRRRRRRRRQHPHRFKNERRTTQLCKDVAAWLCLNQMRSERTQFNLLCEQTVSNVWRKRAYRTILHHRDTIGKTKIQLAAHLTQQRKIDRSNGIAGTSSGTSGTSSGTSTTPSSAPRPRKCWS